MKELDPIQKRLLEEVAGLHKIPEGAYNIRANGEAAGRVSTANIEITPKEDGSGIDIHIKPNTKSITLHLCNLLYLLFDVPNFWETVEKTAIKIKKAKKIINGRKFIKTSLFIF